MARRLPTVLALSALLLAPAGCGLGDYWADPANGGSESMQEGARQAQEAIDKAREAAGGAAETDRKVEEVKNKLREVAKDVADGIDTETPATTGTSTGEAPAPSEAPKTGTALSVLDGLAVKGRAPKTGYSRDQFGQAWLDADRNGCDTRNDMLRRDLVDEEMSGRCKVLSGLLKVEPYTGKPVNFVRGGEYGNSLDADHVVALGNGWVTGIQYMDKQVRAAFANDPLNLLMVDPSSNRQKGDGDAATWLPKNKAHRCAYVARQVAVKAKYGLWVTAPEKTAIRSVLAKCPNEALPTGGIAPRVTFPVK